MSNDKAQRTPPTRRNCRVESRQTYRPTYSRRSRALGAGLTQRKTLAYLLQDSLQPTRVYAMKEKLNIPNLQTRGVATGVDIGIYTPKKISPIKLFMG